MFIPFIILIFSFVALFAQNIASGLPSNPNLDAELLRLEKSETDVKKILNSLKHWQSYPTIVERGKEYIYSYSDSTYRALKVKVFIPKNYEANKPNKLVLLLHGAVGSDEAESEDIFFDALSKKDYIIVRPLADDQKKFNWVVNRYNGQPNPTFSTLANLLRQLKFSFNIADNNIYAYGHSDGADGVFGLQILDPTLFGGFVVYNSMLSNLFDTNFFITNAVNRPLYVAHSSLDDLRPVEQTRSVVEFLKSKRTNIEYKEYDGFKHYDRHLNIDIPFSEEFLEKHSRKCFPSVVYFETNNGTYNVCDWLRFFPKSDLAKIPNSELSILAFNKKNRTFSSSTYYKNGPRAFTRAVYHDNTFTCETDGVAKIQIRIDPFAVDLARPVIVIVNGKEVLKTAVRIDREFLLNNFKENGDRTRLYVNALVIDIKN